MVSNMTEAFPSMDVPSSDKSTPLAGPSTRERLHTRRRKSSGLGSEIRAGDTRAPAFATMDIRPTSPRTIKAQDYKDRMEPSSNLRKLKTLLRRYNRYALKNTWVTPLAMLATFLFLYAVNPTDSNPLHHFIFLSHAITLAPNTSPDVPIEYGKGLWDIAFVSFYMIVLTFTREFIMQKLLRPLAQRSGLKSRAKQSRFMEQAYTAIYFGFIGPFGLYIMSRTQIWYFNTRGMYEGYPHKTHHAEFKFYYLFQAAYWAQQAVVMLLGLEKPRKDFKELIAHHIVTLFLIALSYRFHFTYVGLCVFVTHDLSDFFFATSKILNYLDHPLVGPYFAFFICTWIYLRHYLNLRIIYSIFPGQEFQTIGPYELNWETEHYKAPLSQIVASALLCSLQALNLFWLFLIFRVAYKFVFHNDSRDERSDDDEDEFAEEQRLERLAAQILDTSGSDLLVDGKSSAIRYNGLTNRKAV